jgi:hypothetical protein
MWEGCSPVESALEDIGGWGHCHQYDYSHQPTVQRQSAAACNIVVGNTIGNTVTDSNRPDPTAVGARQAIRLPHPHVQSSHDEFDVSHGDGGDVLDDQQRKFLSAT